jgi:hypothetical protein
MSEDKRCLEAQRDAGFGLQAKKKIVEAGNSAILKNWQSVSIITKEQFLEALEWLCADPLDECSRLTREVGLIPTGCVKLQRVYSEKPISPHCKKIMKITEFCYAEEEDPMQWEWCGANFRIPARNENERKYYADADGMVSQFWKVSISAVDKI